ncbi:PREDICTED: uncharacterized protein LOC104813819 [Tarenaya hassleriana]|uniref:uncharacterized protein LOC104813819 n=1 Tax=Tarenaya hassleriana TaxID=28532 RepID=UPI00053CA082|nr:PREDICTED: uncharacterized protein LOC104813819 [Tarenaya hassleriana]
MSLLDFPGIESEKAYAMKRYGDRRNYLNILRAAEAISAVALLGYWWLPTAMIWLETANDWIRRIFAVVDNHSVLFILINVLIISIIVLSSEKSETESDLYDQYTAAATAVVYPVPVVRDDDSHCKRIDPVKPRIESTSAANWRVPEKTVTAEEGNRVVHCVETVKSSSYRRTQSERRRSTTTTTEMRRVEYRRSESSAAERVSAWGSRSVEGLSNEEFRVTVERFIMEKKKTLTEENDVVVPRRGRHNSRFISDGRRSSCSALLRN